MCVCVCVRACVRARACACACARVHARISARACMGLSLSVRGPRSLTQLSLPLCSPSPSSLSPSLSTRRDPCPDQATSFWQAPLQRSGRVWPFSFAPVSPSIPHLRSLFPLSPFLYPRPPSSHPPFPSRLSFTCVLIRRHPAGKRCRSAVAAGGDFRRLPLRRVPCALLGGVAQRRPGPCVNSSWATGAGYESVPSRFRSPGSFFFLFT